MTGRERMRERDRGRETEKGKNKEERGRKTEEGREKGGPMGNKAFLIQGEIKTLLSHGGCCGEGGYRGV